MTAPLFWSNLYSAYDIDGKVFELRFWGACQTCRSFRDGKTYWGNSHILERRKAGENPEGLQITWILLNHQVVVIKIQYLPKNNVPQWEDCTPCMSSSAMAVDKFLVNRWCRTGHPKLRRKHSCASSDKALKHDNPSVLFFLPSKPSRLTIYHIQLSSSKVWDEMKDSKVIDKSNLFFPGEKKGLFKGENTPAQTIR